MSAMTREELAVTLAIQRAEYERETLAAGYTERHFQSLLPFVKSQAFSLATRDGGVAGIKVNRDPDYGTLSYYARIDWVKLTKVVERKLPTWRAAVARAAEEQA